MQTTPADRQPTLARDTRSDTIGEVTYTSADGRHVWMKPCGGGPEWYVPREYAQMNIEVAGS